MKLREQFEVAKPVASVWSFFEQPEQIANCVPGVETVTVHGEDDIEARLTQSVGPMSATFAGDVRIVERVPEERMTFTATGKSVRGASGNVRASVAVSLEPNDTRTQVTVEADVTLAGALGSVGQKVVSKQAGKVTTAFSHNLEQALIGTATPTTTTMDASSIEEEPVHAATPRLAAASTDSDSSASIRRWIRLGVALAAASLVVNVVALGRSLWRGGR